MADLMERTGENTDVHHRNNNNNIEKMKETVIEEKMEQKEYHWDIVWPNIVLILSIHIAGLYGLFTKFYFIPKWQTFAFNVFTIGFGGMGVTAGRHRLWSHKCYKVSKSLELFLMTWAASIYEQSIYVWCRDHRLHHKYSDTDADPYNSRRGFFFCHIGWFFLRKHKQVLEKGKGIDLSDLEANPIVMFEHKHNKLLAFLFTFLLPSFIPWYFWDEVPEVSMFYCCFWRLILILHITWSVNSFAHLYGWRPYDKGIQPVENDLVALVTAGEGFHNYHHTFPWDYKTAELGNDTCNLTTLFIDILARMKLVSDRKTVSEDLITKRVQRTGDAKLLRQKHNLRYLLIFTTFLFVFF